MVLNAVLAKWKKNKNSEFSRITKTYFSCLAVSVHSNSFGFILCGFLSRFPFFVANVLMFLWYKIVSVKTIHGEVVFWCRNLRDSYVKTWTKLSAWVYMTRNQARKNVFFVFVFYSVFQLNESFKYNAKTKNAAAENCITIITLLWFDLYFPVWWWFSFHNIKQCLCFHWPIGIY